MLTNRLNRGLALAGCATILVLGGCAREQTVEQAQAEANQNAIDSSQPR